ncbi:MAG: gliding motility protein GldB, partial [Dysgonamonadaceae bacterium]|nr:gliding motility protein GldB [Dysgonamonadaceae bacterium]
FILENKHLYTLNYRTTEQYLQSAPHTPSLPVESPGRVGEWLGFQIVKRYMKNHPHTSWEELMGMVDYQKFLKDSKYKP